MLGMTEEQFWQSNPRIIKVWEKAYQEKLKEQNRMAHIQGYYTHCAVAVAIGQALDKKYKGKYLEEPIRIFPLTKEEEEQERKKEYEKFLEWRKNIKPRKK